MPRKRFVARLCSLPVASLSTTGSFFVLCTLLCSNVLLPNTSKGRAGEGGEESLPLALNNPGCHTGFFKNLKFWVFTGAFWLFFYTKTSNCTKPQPEICAFSRQICFVNLSTIQTSRRSQTNKM